MITQALLDLTLTVLQWFWGLLPSWTVETPDLQPFVNELHKWNQVFPVSELRDVMALSGTLFGALVAVKVIRMVIDWVTNVIP